MHQNVVNEICELKKLIRDLDRKLEIREMEKRSSRLKFWADFVYISYFVFIVIVAIITIKLGS